MTIIYNRPYLIDLRRALRKNHTKAERILWARLRKKQFHNLNFRRQFSVGPYILDFYCHKKRLAIEVDGSQHLQQKEYDDFRTQSLKSVNIRVVLFWNREVLMNIEGVLTHIEKEVGF
jgi:very-short-patch-repair endonuclease